MSQTWHEYTFPVDTFVHAERLKPELSEGATTSDDTKVVTCPGCLSWIEIERAKFRSGFGMS